MGKFCALKPIDIPNFAQMRRKKRFSGWSVVISVSMVLFVLGLFGVLIINTQRLTGYLQENVLAILYFDSPIPESKLSEKTEEIMELSYVKSAEYVTADEAARRYGEVLGKDFVEILGANPIPASIEVNLDATEVEGKVDDAIKGLEETEGVTSMQFQQDLVAQIEKNKHVAGVILMALAVVLLIVSLILINNAIRLDVYSRRFIVKSMQLVGASEWFIIRPFMLKSLVITLLASGIACVLVVLTNQGLTGWVEQNIFEVQHIFKSDITIYSILFAIIIVLGIGIVLPSTYFATKKYLRLRIDDLY